VVPTGDRACAADASFETSQTGLSALLTCSSTGSQAGRAASVASARPRLAARHAEPEVAARPLKEVHEVAEAPAASAPAKHVTAVVAAPPSAEGAKDVQERAALAALVALPAEGTITHKAVGADEAVAVAAKVVPPSAPAPSSVVSKVGATAVAVPPAAAAVAVAFPKSPAVTGNASPAPMAPAASASGPASSSPSVSPSVSPSASASASTPAAPSSGSLMGPLVGVLVLVGGAAFWWKKKRGLALPRRIQIKETASLGPKRSLVVAEVDGERLILASSEAGITLLRSEPLQDRADRADRQPVRVTREESAFSVAANAATAAMSASSASSTPPAASALALFRTNSRGAAPAPVTESFQASAAVSEAASALFSRASEQRDEPTDLEGAASGLSRLRSLSGGLSQVFRSQEAKADARADAKADAKAKAEPAPERSLEDDWFVDVLDDSVEDQELRAKLAQGIGGRVT